VAKKALVPVADGSEEIEVVCIIYTLRRAGVDVTIASVMRRRQITASRQTELVADCLIEDCRGLTFDLVVLPGGMPGAEHLRDDPDVCTLLTGQRAAGRTIGAICAAPAVVLLPLGLLSGYRATCFPSFLPLLREAESVTALEERVVVDRDLITSRGPGTAIEFALALVGHLLSTEVAVTIGQRMLVR